MQERSGRGEKGIPGQGKCGVRCRHLGQGNPGKLALWLGGFDIENLRSVDTGGSLSPMPGFIVVRAATQEITATKSAPDTMYTESERLRAFQTVLPADRPGPLCGSGLRNLKY